MSVAATTWAWKQDVGETGAKLTLVALADFADERGSCYPSQATLAAMTSQGERTVRRHLKELEDRGLLTRESRWDHGHRSTDRYVLNLDQSGHRGHHDKPAKMATGQNGRKLIPATNDTHTGHERQFIPATVAREPSVEPSVNRQRDARKRGTRIPDDFTVTDDMREWARKEAPAVDLNRETDRFVDYWRAVSGAKGVKLDWTSTWRNWMRKQSDWIAERGGPPSGQTSWSPWDAFAGAER